MEEFAENKNPDRNRNENLILRGNAFYEIDLRCLEKKRKKQEEAKKRQQKRQRR